LQSALADLLVQFLHGVLRPSLTGDLSLVKCVWDVFHVLLDRAFVFGLHIKKTKKLLKLFKNLGFLQP